MFRLYWFIVMFAAAIAAHAAHVLFMPGATLEARLEQVLGPGTNSFRILSPAQAVQLLPSASPHDVVGLCRFDLTRGSVQLDASFPRGDWMFLVYTVTGRQAYSLSRTEAGETKFTVELIQAPGLIKDLLALVDDKVADVEDISNAGWRVNVPEANGLALVWVPLSDEIFRKPVEEGLKRTRCHRM